MSKGILGGAIAGAVAAIFVTGLSVLTLSNDRSVDGHAAIDVVTDRVGESRILRCGYVTYAPGLMLDPNTGEISGIAAEVVEGIAANLGWTVDWVEQAGWDSMIEGLRTNRYDMVCSAIYENTVRARLVDFSSPMFYGGISVFARDDDPRFDGDLSRVNAPDVTISTIDGEISDILARSQFPNARTVSLPQLSDVSQMLLLVQEDRADVTLVEQYAARDYLRNNPGAVRNVSGNQPIQVFPNVLLLPADNPGLKRIINAGIAELHNSGEMERIVLRYAGADSGYFLVERPYRPISQ